MPRYTLQAPDGRRVVVEGDSPPSQAQIEKIFASVASKEGPKMSPQQERSPTDWLRDWFTGAASERRILDEERAAAREAGVGLHPTAGELAEAAMIPAAPIAAGAAPGAAVAGTLVGVPAGMAGGEVAERVGEEIGPGVGGYLRPVGETIGAVGGGGLAGGGVARGTPAPLRGAGRETSRMVGEMARMGSEGARRAKRLPLGELAAEGVLDTALSAVPGGTLVGGLARRGLAAAGRKAIRGLKKRGTNGAKPQPVARPTSKATTENVLQGMKEPLTQSEVGVLNQLQGLAKSKGNKSNIENVIKEMFPDADEARAVRRFVFSSQTRI